MKHWVKGGYYYYHNLDTQRGGWDEPPGFVQNSAQLSREEIQVGLGGSRWPGGGLARPSGHLCAGPGAEARLK